MKTVVLNVYEQKVILRFSEILWFSTAFKMLILVWSLILNPSCLLRRVYSLIWKVSNLT